MELLLTEINRLILKFNIYADALNELSSVMDTEKIVLHLLEERLNKDHPQSFKSKLKYFISDKDMYSVDEFISKPCFY